MIDSHVLKLKKEYFQKYANCSFFRNFITKNQFEDIFGNFLNSMENSEISIVENADGGNRSQKSNKKNNFVELLLNKILPFCTNRPYNVKSFDVHFSSSLVKYIQKFNIVPMVMTERFLFSNNFDENLRLNNLVRRAIDQNLEIFLKEYFHPCFRTSSNENDQGSMDELQATACHFLKYSNCTRISRFESLKKQLNKICEFSKNPSVSERERAEAAIILMPFHQEFENEYQEIFNIQEIQFLSGAISNESIKILTRVNKPANTFYYGELSNFSFQRFECDDL
jgi:hypothetical protein